MTRKPEFQATVDITHWLGINRVNILNVAGPRASSDPKIYAAVTRMLEAVLYLGMIEDNMPEIVEGAAGLNLSAPLPETPEQAVSRLMDELPLKDRATMAKMTESDLNYLHPSLGSYIKVNFRLEAENEKLLAGCRALAQKSDLDADGAVRIIIRNLWKKLNQTHRLRRVK